MNPWERDWSKELPAKDPWEADWSAPAEEPPGRFAQNMKQSFLESGTLGGVVTNVQSGRVAGMMADDAQIALDDMARTGEKYAAERLSTGKVSPYAGWSAQQLQDNITKMREQQASRSAQFQKDEAERRAQYDALPPWYEGAANDPVGAVGRGATSLAGQLAGSVLQPENLVGGLARGAASLAGRFTRGASESALTGALVEQPVQQTNIAAGRQQEFDPIQAVVGTALSGIVGGTVAVAPGIVQRAAQVFRAKHPDVQADAISARDIVDDPDVRRFLESNGITQPDDPRYAQAVQRLSARREEEAARVVGAPENAPGMPRQPYEPSGGEYRARIEREDPDIDPAARSTVGAGRPEADVVAVDRQGTALRYGEDGTLLPDDRAMVEAGMRGRGEAQGTAAGRTLVPIEPQPERMTPDDITRAQRGMSDQQRPTLEAVARAREDQGLPPEAARPAAGDRLYGQQDRVPQTREGVQGQREAGEAFRLADAQRERVDYGVRDTQAAGRPAGVDAKPVHLVDGFPVRIVTLGEKDTVFVQRYDPRTGGFVEGSIPFGVKRDEIRTAQYAAEPRMAQDFNARAESPRNPEEPRMPNEGVRAQPDQTYRQGDHRGVKEPDDNPFPGATERTGSSGPGGPGGNPGNSPLPWQPPGEHPGPKRARNEEELYQRYKEEEARRKQEEQSSARDSGGREKPRDKPKPSSSREADPDADGRYAVDDDGFVVSDKGGPIVFADQKQAAKWILRTGHAKSPDQIFEIANHPNIRNSFTAKERGRSEPPGGGAGPSGAGGRGGSGPNDADAGAAGSRRSDTGANSSAESRRADASGRPSDEAGRQQNSDGPEGGGAPFSGSKFYSTPFDPEAVKGLGAALARLFRRETASMRKEAGELRDIFSRQNATGKSAARAVGDTLRVLAHSSRAVMRMLAERYPAIKELAEVVDHLATDPGSHRVVKQTYEEAVEQEWLSRANRLDNLLSPLKGDREALSRVGDILAGRAGTTSAQERAVAGRVRTLLDETHDYLRKAGVELGYVRGRYFPRTLDMQKIMDDPAGFLRSAEQAYRRTGLSAEDAKLAAEEWHARALGIDTSRHALGDSSATSLTKGRVLPQDTDRILADYYVRDTATNLAGYFHQAAKRAEFARRFGADGEKLDAAIDAARRQGMDPRDLRMFVQYVDNVLGFAARTRPGLLDGAMNWISTAGTLALLPRAVISSLSEGLTAGVRSGRTSDALSGFINSYRAAFRSTAMEDTRQAAEMIGAIGEAANKQLLLARIGGAGSELQARLTSGMFQRTGLQALTDGQRVAALRVAQTFVSQRLDDLASGSRATAAKAMLADLGVSPDDAVKLREWLAKSGGIPPAKDILGDGDSAKLYRAALGRFVNEAIQNPKIVDKPLYASLPAGRMAYGIMSFMFAFTRNVLLRGAKQVGSAITGRTGAGDALSAGERLQYAGILAPFALLAAAQAATSQVREKVYNPEAQQERQGMEKAILAASRGQLFGNLDPLINAAVSVKYQRDLSNILVGAAPSYFLDRLQKAAALLPKSMGGPNTPNTNNAEWNAARAAYQGLFVPVANAALSIAPGGPVAKTAYGAMLLGPSPIGLSSPQASRDFATAVVGKRTVEPVRNQRGAAPADGVTTPELSAIRKQMSHAPSRR